MVEPYSFQEGVDRGHAILYEELGLSVDTRRQAISFAIGFWIGLLVFVSIVVIYLFFSNKYEGVKWLLLGLTTVIDVLTGLMIVLSWQARRDLTPFRIYETGFSIGYGTKPFYSFSDVQDIREIPASKHIKPSLKILFTDETFKNVSEYDVRTAKEYSIVKDLLLRRFGAGRAAGPEKHGPR